MDGKRGVRASGTDGSDFTSRQQISQKYADISSAKSFIGTASILIGAIALATTAVSFYSPQMTGTDYGILYTSAVGFTGAVIALMGRAVSTQAQEANVQAISLLGLVYLALSIFHIGSICFGIVTGQSNSILLSVPWILIHAFASLLSFRSYQAGKTIIGSFTKGSSSSSVPPASVSSVDNKKASSVQPSPSPAVKLSRKVQ